MNMSLLISQANISNLIIYYYREDLMILVKNQKRQKAETSKQLRTQHQAPYVLVLMLVSPMWSNPRRSRVTHLWTLWDGLRTHLMSGSQLMIYPLDVLLWTVHLMAMLVSQLMISHLIVLLWRKKTHIILVLFHLAFVTIPSADLYPVLGLAMQQLVSHFSTVREYPHLGKALNLRPTCVSTVPNSWSPMDHLCAMLFPATRRYQCLSPFIG